MKSASVSGALNYDPLLRLYENYGTYFIHEGGQLVGDYYNGNIVGRYIPGPGTDEPLVQVDKLGARTWFHADERGSVIAGSNAAGANARIVLYDEYGKRGAPAPTGSASPARSTSSTTSTTTRPATTMRGWDGSSRRIRSATATG
jgi:hypothetical protein